MTENTRNSYGDGAQGEDVVPESTTVSFGTRIRYYFDNSLAKSGAFVLYAFLLLTVLSALNAIFAVWLRGTTLATPSEPNDIVNELWMNMFGILGAVPVSTWAERWSSLFAWVSGTAVNAVIIGFAATAIHNAVNDLKAGRSAVIAKHHTLILGWSNRVFPILRELAVANSNVRKATIVIFANEDRVMMDHEIQARVGKLRGMRIITRKGDPTNPTDLTRANIGAAKSVIILDADEHGDATVVSTVLSVKATVNNPAIPVVAEVDNAETAEALTVATRGQVRSVRSHDVIARVTAQASRQPGLSTVILDLLDFDGDELYFASIPALEGKTYGDALLAFAQASVIGLIDDRGNPHINPPTKTAIGKGWRIVAIAEDDDRVVYTGVDKATPPKGAVARTKRTSAEHILVIGWSSMGRAVVGELSQFLPKGSTVHIVAMPKYVDPAELASLSFPGVDVSYSASSGDMSELVTAASAKHYDEIIVLGYRNAIGESEADAQTMLTMLQMNALFDDNSNGIHPTRLVAELLDSRKINLARVAAVDDLVVSDNLAALLVAQISENPTLAPVLDDLFDADGASINTRPIEHYAPLGKPVTVASLVAAGAAKNESVIGFRVAANARTGAAQGVVLNPEKTRELTPAAGDTLIVVGHI